MPLRSLSAQIQLVRDKTGRLWLRQIGGLSSSTSRIRWLRPQSLLTGNAAWRSDTAQDYLPELARYPLTLAVFVAAAVRSESQALGLAEVVEWAVRALPPAVPELSNEPVATATEFQTYF